jgi:N5-(carboxyethyl)ornithine synthase
MNTVGFIISQKENEKRRALIPENIHMLKYPKNLYFEYGYGKVLGIEDDEYISAGCQMVSRAEALSKDIICDPKIGDAEYLKELDKGQIIFGWVHAVQNREITDVLINNKLTAYAWEDMFDCGRHVFWRNNEIAGEAAIMHAFRCHGIMPYNTKVAILGRGNTASGAYKILTLLGADIVVYNRRTEKLFQKELGDYDVIVNGVLWDTSRTDHIIYKADLLRMKKESMIIDISCDRNGGIETCIPTTIDNPTYIIDGIMHYAVDHTPSLFFKTATKEISLQVSKYLDELITGYTGDTLNDAKIFDDGKILNQDIINFQQR